MAGEPDTNPTIVWLRDDLRLADNPALHAAVSDGAPVIPLFVLEDVEGEPGRGGASLWWLHHSLESLARELDRRGSALVLRRGDPREILRKLSEETGASRVVWNRRYGPAGQRDASIAMLLRDMRVEVEEHAANLLHDPDRLRTKGGTAYRVFTPFWRALAAAGPPRSPLPAPSRLASHGGPIAGDRLDDWNLLPSRPDWAGGLRETWEPGELGAHKRLRRFLETGLERYAEGRDRPDREDTSGLSPHLHIGEIGPVQIWHAVERHGGRNAEKFLSELAWRDFSYHLLDHNPSLASANFNGKFDSFPWISDDEALNSWQQGCTGYPIVDAGMRQLWETGWMHNRVRMIAASFLVKDLMIDWRRGADWFWDTLVDADPANNAASWQWVAGSGADAAPYFRIFNPVLQGERFDPEGNYVRRWVPELANLAKKHIHRPWEAPDHVLQQAGIRLGRDYPRPMVDHKIARQRALAVFRELPQS